jgi:hypothetical protein
MIQSKVKSIDNHQHDTTSNKRHMRRVTDRVVEDLLENLPEVGYVTKKQQQQYQTKLFKIETSTPTHLWKHRLEEYALKDVELGSSKEDRLKLANSKSNFTIKKKKKAKSRKPKLKSVVVVPKMTTATVVPSQKRLFSLAEYQSRIPKKTKVSPSETEVTSKPFIPIRSFVESVLARYGIQEEEKSVLPPKWTQTHSDWGTLYISEYKLNAIRSLPVDLKTKKQMIINQQEKKPSDKDIHQVEFDWSKIDLPDKLDVNTGEEELDLGLFDNIDEWV